MCDDTDFKIKKINQLNVVVWSCCLKKLLCGIHCFTTSIRDFVSQLIDSVNKGKVPHTYDKLIRVTMTFQYKKLLLLKSPQNNVVSNFWPLKNQSESNIYMPGALWDKIIEFTDEPVVQCDVPAAKSTLLNDDNDDRK